LFFYCWVGGTLAFVFVDGVNLFGGQILASINNTDDDNVSSNSSIRIVAKQQLIALGMGIPACLCAIATLKAVGTKKLQVWGFVFIAVCFVFLATLFAPLSHGKNENHNALFVCYCFLLFSLSYGPNLTTYVLPAQLFDREVRATLNGVSAACGKLGAFTGVYMFGAMAETTSYATGTLNFLLALWI
jgi:MFS transporter, PHS family, inorganic phosphate transporter